MTTELLDELQALLDAGTPGHWDGQAGYLTMEDKVLLLGWDKCDEDLENSENNCLLIAKLKNSAPALLSAARENLRLREALEDALDHVRKGYGLVEDGNLSTQTTGEECVSNGEKALGKEVS